MRRMEQNLAEKRVLQSIEMKNSLKITYERLKLEEKAFISSTKFNQRQLLSRQNKLRQLQYTAQNCKGLSLEKRPKFRTGFPVLPLTSESVIRSYPSNLTLPSSRKSLRTSGEGKHVRSLPEKEAFDRKQSALNTSSKFLYSTFKNSANEKQNEFQVPLKQGETKFNADSKTKQIGLRVNDIIAYSTRFGKGAKKPRKGISSTDRENMYTMENHKPSSKNENFPVSNEKMWKNNVDSLTTTQRKMCETAKSPEKEELNSTESIISPVQSKKDRPEYFTSDQYHISDEMKTGKENEANEDKAAVVLRTEDLLPRDVNLKNTDDVEKNSAQLNTNNTSEKEKTLTDSQISTSLQNPQPKEIDGPNVFVSLNSNPSLDLLEDGFQWPSSSVRPLISRKPSWNGYEDLPALGRIRRGSLCDVKTFTSGKVLDLLSLCEAPTPDSEKETKQYLDADDENLKYCRYLRSVTSDEALQDGERLGIPQKYRPSKNIIIGHTKVTPLQ